MYLVELVDNVIKKKCYKNFFLFVRCLLLYVALFVLSQGYIENNIPSRKRIKNHKVPYLNFKKLGAFFSLCYSFDGQSYLGSVAGGR